MDAIWQQIFTSLGWYSVLVAAITWLAKTIISHLLSKDIDNHKANLDKETKLYEQQLKAQFDSKIEQIEQLKSELQIRVKENEIRFTKLHEKRVEIISDFYRKLEEILSKTLLLTLKLERDSAKDYIIHARELWVECGQVSEFFQKNKLYFSKNLAEKIESFLSIISEPSKAYVFSRISKAQDKDIVKFLNEWSKKGRDARRIRELIEDEFRETLGIESKIQT